jgi:YD repeat-containing protein
MDAIRKHAADARWLDALDALDALSADDIDDAALAAEVRHHGARFRSARNAFEDPEDDNHQWQGRTERFGVETAFRYDDAGLLWLRTAGNMEDVDLFHTVAVLREIQLFGEWIPFLRQSCVIKAQDFARLLAHFTIGVRGVLSRDCVFRVAACNHALSGASLEVWERPRRPPLRKLVRGARG